MKETIKMVEITPEKNKEITTILAEYIFDKLREKNKENIKEENPIKTHTESHTSNDIL